jgi:hypothetical protein
MLDRGACQLLGLVSLEHRRTPDPKGTHCGVLLLSLFFGLKQDRNLGVHGTQQRKLTEVLS